MTRYIGICMAKGGSGKTTTAVNLSHALALLNKRVLLLDTDTQNQAAFSLGVQPKYGLADLALGNVSAKDALYEARPNLHLLRGGKLLGQLKAHIGRIQMNPQLVIKRTIDPFADQYDYVIADSHPSWDSLTINLLFLVTEVICPVRMEPLALDGIGSFLAQLSDVQEHNENVHVRHFLPFATDRRIKQTEEILTMVRQKFGNMVADEVRYCSALSKAAGQGKTIFEYDKRSTGATDYAALVERILDE